MTVFINGRFATQPLSGVQRYAGEMVRALDRRERERGPDYVLLSPVAAPPIRLTNIEQRWIGRGGGHRWEQWAFARAAREGVALSLAMSGPLLHRRQLVVLHDAAVHRRPRHFTRQYGVSHRMLERGLVQRGARVATVSHFSRRELAAVLRLDPRDIIVAPNGADHAREPPDPRILTRLGLIGRTLFVTIGNQSANKNVGVAARALARIGDRNLRLVIVGEGRAAVFAGGSAGPVDARIIAAGRLTDGEVIALLGEARALIFPSRYEGFGLPPLEAMAAGCPVLASDCAAAIEVCGGAAAHFAPDDDEQLATLMVRAVVDEEWRGRRIMAGHERAGRYRWAESAAVIAAACAELELAR